MTEPKIKNVRTSSASESAAPEPKMRGNTMEVTDSRGRVIVVKKLNGLEKMRLSRVVGADGAVNQAYFGYALLAASVISIDGEPEVFPMTIRAVEAMVSQLDDDGLDVVGQAVGELNGVTTQREDIEAAKN